MVVHNTSDTEIEIESILASTCVVSPCITLRHDLQVHNTTYGHTTTRRDMTQVLTSYCEPSFRPHNEVPLSSRINHDQECLGTNELKTPKHNDTQFKFFTMTDHLKM